VSAEVPVPLREAASVIILRRKLPEDVRTAANWFEVLLLRRRAGASFMAQAYVFPGGATEDGEDARTSAARELFEEAGILLAKDADRDGADTVESPNQDVLRKKLLAGESAATVMAAAGLAWWTEALVPWSHWITPSGEGNVAKRRFSARFFVIELPAGQDPSYDAQETVDLVWATPTDALARSAELKLPPPQVRTFWELLSYKTIEDVLDAGRTRAGQPHPIMPRLAIGVAPPTILLPWDPAYEATSGEGTPLTYKPSWAIGPSRFVMEDGAWKHVAAGSTTAG
jgi:8-oxo-dGTP pyrophosphatase MutT (NUDIX family)